MEIGFNRYQFGRGAWGIKSHILKLTIVEQYLTKY